MARRRIGPKAWAPQYIKGANAQWDPLAGIGAFAAAWALEHRILFLTTAIEPADSRDAEEWSFGVGGLIAGMMMMDRMEPGKPITLYINSPGGDIHAGMALIQTMRDLRSPVHTFVLQLAASMAAVVAIAGSRRYAYPGARWLLHRDYGQAAGDYLDLQIAANELKVVDKTADQVVLNFTKIEPAKLEEMQQKDHWLGIRAALKWGIVDDIRYPRQGPSGLRPNRQGKGGWLPFGVA